MRGSCHDLLRAPWAARWRLAGAALVAVAAAAPTFADEPARAAGPAEDEAERVWVENETSRFVPEWDLSLILREKVPMNSDYFLHAFRLETSDGDAVAESPWLYGPILISRPNRQLVACEGNGIDQGESIRFFDLLGGETARFPHPPASVSDCGTTEDERLYWFLYVTEEEAAGAGRAIRGTFVVLDRTATEVARRFLAAPGVVRFEWGGASYERTFESLPVPP